MKREQVIQISFLLLRVVYALLFIQSGGLKLFGWFGGMPMGHGTAVPMTQIWFAGVLEVFGGALIMLGLCVRPIAFVLSGEMAIAYFQAHQPHGTWPIQNHGEQAVLYCFLFLFMAPFGAGDYRLDALIRRKKGQAGAADA